MRNSSILPNLDQIIASCCGSMLAVAKNRYASGFTAFLAWNECDVEMYIDALTGGDDEGVHALQLSAHRWYPAAYNDIVSVVLIKLDHRVKEILEKYRPIGDWNYAVSAALHFFSKAGPKERDCYYKWLSAGPVDPEKLNNPDVFVKFLEDNNIDPHKL